MNAISDPFQTRGFGGDSPWVDLVNSAILDGFGRYTELLDDPAWLRSFVRHWQLPVLAREPVPQTQLRELRTLLRGIVESSSGRLRLTADQVKRLNDWMKVPVVPSFVEHQNGLELKLDPAQIGWETALAAVTRSFGETLQLQNLNRLKVCANDDCKWVFLDQTKGNIRKWCNDATCGNRDRVRRSRARKA